MLIWGNCCYCLILKLIERERSMGSNINTAALKKANVCVCTNIHTQMHAYMYALRILLHTLCGTCAHRWHSFAQRKSPDDFNKRCPKSCQNRWTYKRHVTGFSQNDSRLRIGTALFSRFLPSLPEYGSFLLRYAAWAWSVARLRLLVIWRYGDIFRCLVNYWQFLLLFAFDKTRGVCAQYYGRLLRGVRERRCRTRINSCVSPSLELENR